MGFLLVPPEWLIHHTSPYTSFGFPSQATKECFKPYRATQGQLGCSLERTGGSLGRTALWKGFARAELGLLERTAHCQVRSSEPLQSLGRTTLWEGFARANSNPLERTAPCQVRSSELSQSLGRAAFWIGSLERSVMFARANCPEWQF